MRTKPVPVEGKDEQNNSIVKKNPLKQQKYYRCSRKLVELAAGSLFFG